MAVYDVARVIDDLGDQSTGDRAMLRTEVARISLASIWAAGWPGHPVLRRLVPAVRARPLDDEPLSLPHVVSPRWRRRPDPAEQVHEGACRVERAEC